MKDLQSRLIFFTAFALLFLWIDIFIGHTGGGLHHIAMWIPVVLLPLIIVVAFMTGVWPKPFMRKLFIIVCLGVIFTGTLGFIFHFLKLTRDIQGVISWEVLVRLMRYPPLLAPLGLAGIGVLGVMVSSEKEQKK